LAKIAVRWVIKAEAWVFFQTSGGKLMTNQHELWSFLEKKDALKVKTADEKRAAMRAKFATLHHAASKLFAPLEKLRKKKDAVSAESDASAGDDEGRSHDAAELSERPKKPTVETRNPLQRALADASL
jgi:hypothetical protein